MQLLDENDSPIYVTGQNSTSSYAIDLEDQVPVSDETGLETVGFTFKLENTGSIDARYTIYLDDVALSQNETRIDDQYVKYSLTKNNTESSPALLSTTVVENERELDTGIIREDDANTYTLKIWIDEEATNEAMDKVFNATLRVDGVQYVAPPPSEYGEKIAEKEISEGITATYYQPEGTGYNSNNPVKRMSNVKKMDNETRYEGGTLVISGSGTVADNDLSIQLFLGDVQSIEDLPDEDGHAVYKYNPTNLVVEEGITGIGDSAFGWIKSITNVDLPYSLVSIGKSAFGSTSISEIYLSGNIQEIGQYAFCPIAQDYTIYCETQSVADAVISSGNNSNFVIVDPTKFE